MKVVSLVFFAVVLSCMYSFSVLYPRTDDVYPTNFQIYKVKPGTSYYDKWFPIFRRNQLIFSEFIDKFIDYVNKTGILPDEFRENIFNYFDDYEKFHPEMTKEIRAIHQVSGVALDKLIILNFTYEMFSYQDACSQVIIRDKNGNIFTARNLDYFFQEYYSFLSLQFDYVDENDKVIYSTSQFVGYVISVSGIRHGAYTIALNQRETMTLETNFLEFVKGAYANEYLLREILMTEETYEGAVKNLLDSEVIAACYYGVSGTKGNEGMVIEKGRIGEGNTNTYELTDKKWFLVVTNDDLDKPDSDGRSTFAIETVEKIGQNNMTMDVLLNDVMKQFPLLHTLTISTTIMNAKEQYIQQMGWY